MIMFAFAAMIAGCASASPQLYTLSPTAQPVNAKSNLTISVGPVTVPAAVDRSQLVLSVAPHQVAVDEFNRWASPLKTDIARVVAQNLSLILGTPYASVFPQSVSVSPSYRVTIDVMHFESIPGDSARLTAIWSVRRTADEQSQGGSTALSEPVRDNTYAALVAAHSKMLGTMSSNIAATISTLMAGNRKENMQDVK